MTTHLRAHPDARLRVARWSRLLPGRSRALVLPGEPGVGKKALLDYLAGRAGADIVEVEGSHVIITSRPQAVTDLILKAAARAVVDSHP
jgi:predicted ATPase